MYIKDLLLFICLVIILSNSHILVIYSKSNNNNDISISLGNSISLNSIVSTTNIINAEKNKILCPVLDVQLIDQPLTTNSSLPSICRTQYIWIPNYRVFTNITIQPSAVGGVRGFRPFSGGGYVYEVPDTGTYNITALIVSTTIYNNASLNGPSNNMSSSTPTPQPNSPQSTPTVQCVQSIFQYVVVPTFKSYDPPQCSYSLTTINLPQSFNNYTKILFDGQPYSGNNTTFVASGLHEFNVTLQSGDTCRIPFLISPISPWSPNIKIKPTTCQLNDGSIVVEDYSSLTYTYIRLFYITTFDNGTIGEKNVDGSNGQYVGLSSRNYTLEFITSACGKQRTSNIMVPSIDPTILVDFSPHEKCSLSVDVRYSVVINGTLYANYLNNNFNNTMFITNNMYKGGLISLDNAQSGAIATVQLVTTPLLGSCNITTNYFIRPPRLPLSHRIHGYPTSCDTPINITLEGNVSLMQMSPSGVAIKNSSFPAYMGQIYNISMPCFGNENYTISIPQIKPSYTIDRAAANDCYVPTSISVVNYLQFEPMVLISSNGTKRTAKNGTFAAVDPGDYILQTRQIGFSNCLSSTSTPITVPSAVQFNQSLFKVVPTIIGLSPISCAQSSASPLAKLQAVYQNKFYSNDTVTVTYTANTTYIIDFKTPSCKATFEWKSPNEISNFTNLVNVFVTNNPTCSNMGSISIISKSSSKISHIYANNILIPTGIPSKPGNSPDFTNTTYLIPISGHIDLKIVFENFTSTCSFNTSIFIPPPETLIYNITKQKNDDCFNISGKITVKEYGKYSLLRGNGIEFIKGELNATGSVMIEYVSQCSSGRTQVYIATDHINTQVTALRVPTCNAPLNDGVFTISMIDDSGDPFLPTNVTIDDSPYATYDNVSQLIYSITPYTKSLVSISKGYCKQNFSILIGVYFEEPMFKYKIINDTSNNILDPLDDSMLGLQLQVASQVATVDGYSSIGNDIELTNDYKILGVSRDDGPFDIILKYNSVCNFKLRVNLNSSFIPDYIRPSYRIYKKGCSSMNDIIEFSSDSLIDFEVTINGYLKPDASGSIVLPIQTTPYMLGYKYANSPFMPITFIYIDPPTIDSNQNLYNYLFQRIVSVNETCQGSMDGKISFNNDSMVLKLQDNSKQSYLPPLFTTFGTYQFFIVNYSNPYCWDTSFIGVSSFEPTYTITANDHCTIGKSDGSIVASVVTTQGKPINNYTATTNTSSGALDHLMEGNYTVTISIQDLLCRRRKVFEDVEIKYTPLTTLIDNNVCQQIVVVPSGGSSNYSMCLYDTFNQLEPPQCSYGIGQVFYNLPSKGYTVKVSDTKYDCQVEKYVQNSICSLSNSSSTTFNQNNYFITFIIILLMILSIR